MMISHKLFLIFLQKLFAKDNFIPPFIARLLCLLFLDKNRIKYFDTNC